MMTRSTYVTSPHEMDEEKAIIRNTIVQLNCGMICYIYYEEQVEKIIKKYGNELEIIKEDFYYKLIPPNAKKKGSRCG